MVASAYLVILLSQLPGVASQNQLTVRVQPPILGLEWADAEHRLRGTVSTDTPRAGQPMNVDVSIGSIEGAPFDGPVMMTLRPVQHVVDKTQALRVENIDDHDVGEVVTVKKAAGELWSHTFTPKSSGKHVLQFSFYGGRQKVTSTVIDVQGSLAPKWLGAVVALVLIIAAISFGLTLLFRTERKR